MKNIPGNTNASFTDFSFKKTERLRSKKLIELLFSKGESIKCYPLKVVYLPVQTQIPYPAQAGFSVGKKLFKHAVKRNLIKRRIKEAYRLNKPFFYNELGDHSLVIFFIYTGKKISDFTIIETAMKKAITTIVENVKKTN